MRTSLSSSALRRSSGPRLPAAAALLAVLTGAGCDSDPPPENGGGGAGRVLLVPGDAGSLEEALDLAAAGDTLELGISQFLGATLVVPSSVTPLVIRGIRNRPTVSPPLGGMNSATLEFQNPKEGTLVEQLTFPGGTPAIRVTGGSLEVRFCDFSGGSVGIKQQGTGTLRATENVMVSPGFFGIEVGVGGSSQLMAHRNTVVDAGDCGMLLSGAVNAEVRANIIAGSVNYGIACLAGGRLTSGSGCNDIFQSGQAHYLNCDEPEDDFHIDPVFCETGRGDYRIDVLSPCAPANSGGCGRVGALDVGCTPTDE